MKKMIFASDLDNTLIHSYKHRRDNDICIELLKGEEQGFMSRRVYDCLSALPDNIELVPLTTRSVEQFERIKLPAGCFRRAITTNGALLFADGVRDEDWRSEQLRFADELMPLMKSLYFELEGDPKLNVVRIVDDMYLYISCSDSSYMGEFMDRYSSVSELDVMASGRKIYFLPPSINKGSALQRLAEREEHHIFTVTAGDSTIDLPMLEYADHAIIPGGLEKLLKNPNRSVYCGDGDFAEFVIDTVLALGNE